MNARDFWNMLDEEHKDMVEEMLEGYPGSDGVVGRIFELYKEGAQEADCTVEEYLKDNEPNEYVKYFYDAHIDRKRDNYYESLEEYQD